ncbi:MAG: carboxypeptidase regulatory-like domain-containing protein [Saprospiraceae bacterium]|nr:carboxypeptidase regulatory-like domain-containing protein [Saprospiraceae bacterium]
MKKFGILLLIIAVAFTACRKDIDKLTVEETPYVPEILKQWQQKIVPVNGSLTGFVADESGAPIGGAAITVGNLTTTTDDYGHFFFTNVPLNARGTLVRVQKPGYFPGSRRFFAIEDAENRVKIELLTKTFSHSFDSQIGGTVDVDGGSTITFAPNSIQNADGTPFTGTVKVASKWLDPTDPRNLDQMPGNLQGVNLLSEEVVMATYGMIVAELETETGEPLNIGKGKTATIKTPVPASLLASAPAEIPLWSYNETYGMWAEEGISKLENGFYVAEVSHFSYWNHDFQDPLIEFTVTFTDENGAPLENYKVVIRQPGTSLYGYGYTCELGIINGLIPQDYDLLLELYGPCTELMYSLPIGPFSGDVDLGTIVVTASTLNATTLTGQLVDCNGDLVQHGLVVFKFDGQTVYEYTNGTPFEVLFSTCAASNGIEVVGIDLDALLQSDPITSGVNGTFDLGDISVCDVQLQNYIRVTVDGVTAVYSVAQAFIDSSGVNTYLFFNDQATQRSIYVRVFGQTVGNYDGVTGNFCEAIGDGINNWQLTGQYFDNFEISAYGNTGEPIIGTFGGTMTNNFPQPPQTVTVTGDFNIIRNF